MPKGTLLIVHPKTPESDWTWETEQVEFGSGDTVHEFCDIVRERHGLRDESCPMFSHGEGRYLCFWYDAAWYWDLEGQAPNTVAQALMGEQCGCGAEEKVYFGKLVVALFADHGEDDTKLLDLDWEYFKRTTRLEQTLRERRFHAWAHRAFGMFWRETLFLLISILAMFLLAYLCDSELVRRS